MVRAKRKNIEQSQSNNKIEKFRNVLDNLMKRAKLTALELAKATGVSEHTINAFKSKENINPTIGTLIPLSEYFGVSVDALLGNDDLPDNYIFGQFSDPMLGKIPLFESSFIEDISYKTFLTLLSSADSNEYSNLYCTSAIYDKSKNFAVRLHHTIAHKLSLSGSWFIKPGCVFIFDTKTEPEDKDIVLVSSGEDKQLLLRYFLKDGENIYYATIDSQSTGLPPSMKNFSVVATVVQTDFKSIERN